jgi:hypothetical protein
MRNVLLLSVLGFASIFGTPMDPVKIEELLHVMNRPKCEMTIPDEDDSGDEKETRRRRKKKIEQPKAKNQEPIAKGQFSSPAP